MRVSDGPEIREMRRAKVLSHRIRVRSLGILREHPASASELARELGVSTQNVAYHLGVMLRHGAIEEVEVREHRGTIETFYRAIDHNYQSLQQNAKLPRAERDANIEQIARYGYEDLMRALAADALVRDDQHATRHMLSLDDQGRRELYDRLLGVLADIDEIKAASAERIARGAAVVRTNVNILMYDAPPAARDEAPGSDPHGPEPAPSTS